MSTDAWRTVWHPLRGKTSCWSFCVSVFFFLWSFTLSEHKNEASGKRELWDCHSLLSVKGKKRVVSIRSLLYYSMLRQKTSLMVTLTQQLEEILKQNHQIWGDGSCTFCEVSKKKKKTLFSLHQKKTLYLKIASWAQRGVNILSVFIRDVTTSLYLFSQKQHKH